MTAMDISEQQSRDQASRALEREIGVFVRRIRHIIDERARLIDPELSPATYTMLMAIDEAAPMRSTALAELFAIDKGAVSRQVQHLVDLRFVDRVRDPVDGRAVLLTVSDVGRTRLAEVDRARREVFAERFADWSVEDFGAFSGLLARYNAAFD